MKKVLVRLLQVPADPADEGNRRADDSRPCRGACLQREGRGRGAKALLASLFYLMTDLQ